ncbi:uncharacterized protein LOC107006195 [Solanum pennellii]|uniref:Uncharacterized protein LOC107006195 n=1 Tax=Solanum pennellii TaxID=28526 RepID=A0ABM1FQN9_SOLPN|nr:uncharacterized protein LOC107006195 [Solanum pennellii]
MTTHRSHQWMQWLHQVEWWYNTNYHTGLVCSPFGARYGYSPPQLSMGPLLDSVVPAAEDLVMKRQQMQQIIKDNLCKAQERMKHCDGLHRSEREFRVGDLTYLKLQPYRQSSISLRKNLKLSSKYYGPYKILA